VRKFNRKDAKKRKVRKVQFRAIYGMHHSRLFLHFGKKRGFCIFLAVFLFSVDIEGETLRLDFATPVPQIPCFSAFLNSFCRFGVPLSYVSAGSRFPAGTVR